MSTEILIDGDQATFDRLFGAAEVDVKPGTLRASGPATLNGKKVCVGGDEKSVSVADCGYKTLLHRLPGKGTLKIQALAGDQTAGKTSSGGARVMLVGSRFTALFEVTSPAKQQTQAGQIPDTTPSYPGTGTFETINDKLRGA